MQNVPDSGDMMAAAQAAPSRPHSSAPDAPASRREKLAEDGAQAQREIAGMLSRARSRARKLMVLRLLLLALGGTLAGLLAGTLLASVNGAILARVIAIVFAAGFAIAAVVVSVRRGLSAKALARALGGPSELLSSVEFSADP